MDKSSTGGDEPVVVETICDGDIPPSATVVAAVAAADDTQREELPPLGTVVDAPALDDRFAERSTRGRVTFRYVGSLVCVRADGVLTVHESEADRE